MAAVAPVSDAKPVEEKKPGILPNRADEPDFKLVILTDMVPFVCGSDKRPVYCDVTIRNTSTDRHSFKVKCTSAEIFRVQPPLGFIKAGESQTIRVWFQNKTIPIDKDKHYFAFYHMKATDTKLKEKDLWSNPSNKPKPDGVRRLRAVFLEKK